MHLEKLAVTLSDEEMREVAEKLGAFELELHEVKAAKKDASKEFSDRITSIEQNIAYQAKIATEGQEVRDVNCEWQIDYVAGVKRLIRLDNEKEVRNEAISDHERQHGLFDAVFDATPETTEELLADPETAVADATAGGPPVHNGEIVAGLSGPQRHARCVCGWLGEIRDDESSAAKDLDGHYIAVAPADDDPDAPSKHVGSVMASSDDEWIADCRCGWVGEMRSTEDAAIQDLDNHYAGDAYKDQPVESDAFSGDGSGYGYGYGYGDGYEL